MLYNLTSDANWDFNVSKCDTISWTGGNPIDKSSADDSSSNRSRRVATNFSFSFFSLYIYYYHYQKYISIFYDCENIYIGIYASDTETIRQIG